MPDKVPESIHNTCTSTPLSNEPGSGPEAINAQRLNELYQQKTGTEISSDPVIARIQREQALVWDKRRRIGSR